VLCGAEIDRPHKRCLVAANVSYRKQKPVIYISRKRGSTTNFKKGQNREQTNKHIVVVLEYRSKKFQKRYVP